MLQDESAGRGSGVAGGAGESGAVTALTDAPSGDDAYFALRGLAVAEIRRVCRRCGFDWDVFVAGGRESGIAKAVYRRAVRPVGNRRVDVLKEHALSVVRGVIAEWTCQPELRPGAEGFLQEQARRGEKGRETQQSLAAGRAALVMVLVAEGVSNNAEIGRRLGMDRSTVSRLRGKADAKPVVGPARAGDTWVVASLFPAPEIPLAERWPVVQFMKFTGVALDADAARWLADVGQCYEAEGRVSDLMDAIRASAGARVDPLAYLERCVANRGDSWTVKAQLLADVLSWAGQKSLEYALAAIGGGYIERPLAYLSRTLQNAVASGKRASRGLERPVAMAVGMARRWAPGLLIVEADESIAAEDTAQRTGYLESFRRRFGRLPWETETTVEDAGEMDGADTPDCCIGLKGPGFDDSISPDLILVNTQSSPGAVKADATLAPYERPDLECMEGTSDQASVRAVGDSAVADRMGVESNWGALRLGYGTTGLVPEGKNSSVLEPGLCRHPVAMLLSTRLALDDVVQVDCAAGCGHWVYSDRGPLECPCHWPAERVARVGRALDRSVVVGHGLGRDVVDGSLGSLGGIDDD